MKNMNAFVKSLVVLSAAVVAFTSAPAQAVTITFGGQVPTDGSGLTSSVGVYNNNVARPGYYIETFDAGLDTTGAPLWSSTITVPGNTLPDNVSIQAGGGFTSLNPYEVLSVTGTMGIAKGSVSGRYAKPANDETFYAYGPGSGTSAAVRVDYAGFLSSGLQLSYLGLYYGSIDTYNNIAFYSGNALITGTGYMADGILEGSEILASQGGTSGNQFFEGSNVYVNLFFDPTEDFTAFEFRTTGIAFEVDNIVTGFTVVPEPATMLLLGLGLVGLAGLRRRFDK